MKLSLVLAFRGYRDCRGISGEGRRAGHLLCSRRGTRALWQPARRMASDHPAQAAGSILSRKGRLAPRSQRGFPATQARTRTELHLG